MSFLFGKTKELMEKDIKREQLNEILKKKYEELQNVQPNETEKQKRERKERFERFKMFNMKIRKNYDEYINDFRKWEEEEREREGEIETSNLLLEKKIKEILKNLNFYNKLNKKEYSREELFLGVIDLEKLNYDDFLAYKLYINLNTTYYELGSNIINENENYTEEYFKRLSILSPMIFIKNVNLEWRMMQLAKSDISIQSPPLPKQSSPKQSSPKQSSPKQSSPKQSSPKQSSPKPKSQPKPPPAPKQNNSSKTNVSISRGSPLTSKKLEEAKSKLKHSQKKINPDNPDYDIEMAFRNLKKWGTPYAIPSFIQFYSEYELNNKHFLKNMNVSHKEKFQIISNAYTNEINRIRRDYVDNNPELKYLNEAEKKLIEKLKKGEQFTRPDKLYKGWFYGTYRVSR